MSLSQKIVRKIFYAFRFTIPRARMHITGILENRIATAASKRIKVAPDFNKKFKTKVLPRWKPYGVKPHKNSFKVLCPEGKPIDYRYIPNGMWFDDILCHYNNLVECRILGHKSIQPLLVPSLKTPETVIQSAYGVFYDNQFNPLTDEQICQRIRSAGHVIVKESALSSGGQGITFIEPETVKDEEILQILKSRKEDCIIQKILKQHKVLNDIHAKSVNTIRFVTFFHKNEVHILSAVLRMGSGDAKVDNIGKGGYACRVHEDGRLDENAVSRAASWSTVHPGGAVFGDIVLPNYGEIVKAVKEAARKVPFFKILGWDIAIDENGEPVFIEYNVRPEQNQKTCGPTFGDMTDEVLAEVFAKKS